MQLVNYLFQKGLLDATVRSHLEAQARAWDVPAHTLLRTFQVVRAEDYLAAYTQVYGLARAEPETLSLNRELMERLPWETWVENLSLPVTLADGTAAVAAADPVSLPVEFKDLHVPRMLILEEEWVELAGRFRGREFLDLAINGLWRSNPDSSARTTFSQGQLVFFWGLGTAVLGGLVVAPLATLITLNAVVNLFYFFVSVFKALLVLVGSTRNVAQKVSQLEIEQLNYALVPRYTILVPVYKEPAVIPHLVGQLKNLNYPLCKLDVKVLLEEGDDETIAAFRASNPPPNFHALIVPNAQPKTKPKACNYGLFFATGQYLTIYDAEDLPEPDQLEKVIIAFQKLPRNVVCIQACLNYFNWRENFLTRMFTLEYSMWFDYNLPGMEILRVPIPLGGTSNHFKTAQLKELGGWDPFNVTEDADLGVRASARGLTVATVDSTTYEEANCRVGNWIRQRSRWIKGYMQTFLVHTRHPVRLIRTIGLKAFLGFVLFIGGTPFIFLMNLLLWAVLAFWLITRTDLLEPLFPQWLLVLAFLNLMFGNFMAIYSCVLAVFRRRNYGLTVFGLLNPFYWLLHGVASYKALWQLIVKPFYWEKTVHGLSQMSGTLHAAPRRAGP